MKNLLLFSRPFKSLIEDDCIYVDKTDLLAKLVSQSNRQIFLSRPRRFGKSLLLSTINEIFQGNPEPFTGLKIIESGYKFIKYPVILLDMSISSYTTEALERNLFIKLNNRAIQDGFTLKESYPGIAIQDLVNTLYEKFNQTGVVVLIDEYDDPIGSNLDNPELAKSNTKILRTFYSAFKTLAQEDKLHFLMVTGVNPYGRSGISVGLNFLIDISFRSEYASICGFTPEELVINFNDYYPVVLKSLISKGYMTPGSDEADLHHNILDYYDGYSWDGITRVLNPFSMAKFFHEAEFSGFWWNTYPLPNILTSVINNYQSSFIPGNINRFRADDFAISLVDQKPSPISLFHTGYLTINKVIISNKMKYYTLRIPNKEVKDNIYKILGQKIFSERVKNFTEEIFIFKNAIIEKNSIDLSNIIKSLYAGLVHRYHDDNESLYFNILLSYCQGLFCHSKLKAPIYLGKFRIFLKFSHDICAIIGFKYGYDENNSEIAAENLALEALRTIELRKYGQEYRVPGNTVIDIGLGVYGRGQALAVFR